MLDLLLGWLKAILRIGILDFFSRIGWKAVLTIVVAVLLILSVLILITGLLIGLII